MATRAKSGSGEWITLAQQFPATLVKDLPYEDLQDGQSPDAYGLGLNKPWYLYKASAPTEFRRYRTQFKADAAIGNQPWTGTCYGFYWNNRLWIINYNSSLWSDLHTVFVSAPGYYNRFVPSGSSRIFLPDYDDHDNIITGIAPFKDSLYIFKQYEIYRVSGVTNSEPLGEATLFYMDDTPTGGSGGIGIPPYDGTTPLPYMTQDTGTMHWAIPLNEMLCWANARGIYGTDGSKIMELTRPVRENVGIFNIDTGDEYSLVGNWERNWLGIYDQATDAVRGVIDLNSQGLFDYVTGTFRWTSPTLVSESASPLTVDRVGFIYDYSGNEAEITFQVKVNDEWQKAQTITLDADHDTAFMDFGLDTVLSCRKWAIRITDMTTGLYVSQIRIHAREGAVHGYSNP